MVIIMIMIVMVMIVVMMMVVIVTMAVMVVVRVVVAGVGVVVVLMPVVPELGLVEQKEKHQAHQQRGKQVVGIDMAFKRLGQQVHEGGGQQGACRQAEQALRPHTGAAPLEPHPHQQRCQPDAADTRRCGPAPPSPRSAPAGGAAAPAPRR